MESWRKVWREGFAPLIQTKNLEALKTALETDDPRLIQGATSLPLPLMCERDWPSQGGCALGYCGAIENGGYGEATVGEVEEYFARLCYEADQRLGEPAACQYWLNWFDDTPRDVMRRDALAEVQLTLEGRR